MRETWSVTVWSNFLASYFFGCYILYFNLGVLVPQVRPKASCPWPFFFRIGYWETFGVRLHFQKIVFCNVDNPMIKGIWAPNLWYCWEFSIIVREFCEPQSPNHRPFTSHGNDKPMPIWGCGIWVYHIFIHWESPNSRLIGFHQWGWVKTYWFSINLRVDEHPFASDFLGKQKGMT